MADWSQQLSREDVTLTDEDWTHIHALLRRHDPQTIIQAVFAEYPQWKRQSMSSTQTSSTGYLSNGKSSIESGTSSVPTADTLFSSTRSQFGNTLAKPNQPRIFFCTYHEELHLPTPFFRRKAECKAHMMRFHNLGSEWKCPTCQTIFDRDIDYDKHNRDEHAGQPVLPATDVVTNLLPKQVFACGFQGCENLYGSWDEWFDHITGHMKKGKAPSDWSYNVVIRNLLLQRDLRDHWEQMMLRTYGTTQHALKWKPSSARQLCQKLECRDFRPGIQTLVEDAYLIGLLASAPVHSVAGQTMQIHLDTPSCDFVPCYRDNDNLDRILMRPVRVNSTSTSVLHDHPPQYHQHIFEGHQAAGDNFDFVDVSSVPGPSGAARSRVGPYQSSASLQGYEQTQMEQYTHFSPPAFNEDLPRAPESFDFNYGVQGQTVSNSPRPNRDPQPSHILQELQYFDYPKFAKANTPRSWTPGALIRRARSSVPLSSKKSHSSLEADPTQATPAVPPVHANSITPPGRPCSSSGSQRSRQSRKTGRAASQIL